MKHVSIPQLAFQSAKGFTNEGENGHVVTHILA